MKKIYSLKLICLKVGFISNLSLHFKPNRQRITKFFNDNSFDTYFDFASFSGKI